MAVIHKKNGDYSKSVEMYERALKISIKFNGENSIQNTPFLNNLGSTYYSKLNNK